MRSSRRQFMLGAGGCAACMSGLARAHVLPTDLPPLVDVDYEPVDADERGIWQSMEQIEETIQASPQRLNAPELQGYTGSIIEQLMGRETPDLRIYLMRSALFNASMFPTGMMVVNTGLMARVRNEAQLAAVLGHEAGTLLPQTFDRTISQPAEQDRDHGLGRGHCQSRSGCLFGRALQQR